MTIIKSPHLCDRRDFGAFCNFHRVRIAVEVGVDQGNFSSAFLHQWRGEKMYLVDSYPSTPGYFMHDREFDYQCVLHVLGRHRNKCRFIRAESVKAPALLRKGDIDSIGFVYLDGDHSHPAVTEDIKAWWPVVQQGGILAGHDWNWDGVSSAVVEFADKNGLDVYHTHENKSVGPSWYVFKK